VTVDEVGVNFPLADAALMRKSAGRPPEILFKISVRLQGGPKRAAHAAAWARVRRLAVAHDGHEAARRLACKSVVGPL
jgi:hypothetical protein